jgi:hypothetical protein
MYALPVQNLPKGNEWLYEVKFDGYLCLAGIDSTGVTLWSRRGNLSQSNSRISPVFASGLIRPLLYLARKAEASECSKEVQFRTYDLGLVPFNSFTSGLTLGQSLIKVAHH